jgi:hypothetical protein
MKIPPLPKWKFVASVSQTGFWIINPQARERSLPNHLIFSKSVHEMLQNELQTWH